MQRKSNHSDRAFPKSLTKKFPKLSIILCCLIGLLISTQSIALGDFPFSLPKIPGVGEVLIPDVQNLLKEKPPITTSFADANNKIFFPDDYSANQQYKPLTQLSRGPSGGFLLRPGYYESTLQSYCLHAGTHGPGKGEGYLNAPLKGSRKKIVQNILLNSVKNPDIPQRNIQILIWAILARTKINDLQSDIRQTANRLLTPDEIKELNGGVLGMIPPQALKLATASLPPFARRILEAENQLRQMLTQSQTNYSSLESIAVLLGDPSESGQNVPRGRWSDHPGGYYIRYLPNSYSQTLVQLYVPENFQSKDKDGKPQEYDPSGDVAVPNNTSRQRLAQSARLFKS